MNANPHELRMTVSGLTFQVSCCLNPQRLRLAVQRGASNGKSALLYWRMFFCIITGVTIWGLASATAHAGRDVSLAIAATKQSRILISWRAQSATPAGGTMLIPQFQVLRSFDLKHWMPMGSMITGTNGQSLSVIDGLTNAAYYRVQSSIVMEYAQLQNADLSGGDLEGADFFGAGLFSASLSQATLTGANLA